MKTILPSTDFFFFFAMVAVGVIVLIIILLSRKRFQRIYKPKGPYLLSAGENRFFDVLTHCIDADMYICPKVRLADLIEVNFPRNDPNFWRHLARINQKHVDFVICRKSDFAPLVVIELDGGSHNERARTERDLFVDGVFQSADIPLLHIPVKSFYPYEEIRGLIAAAIKHE